ncbi:MAG: rhomboid family intramembrane serine protease [Planctomycetota bacterium]|jgi:membrane associated rhomboid family serine protease
MGLYDRDYGRANFRRQFGGMPRMRMGFPQLTPMVKKLLIINVAVFFVGRLGAESFLLEWFAVYPKTLLTSLQLWRYISYQFLHGDILHILFNMLGLYFLGPTLEKHWGGKRFLWFYLGCGMAGGLFYPLLTTIGFLSVGPMIGASGAVLGMLAACAILFPHFIVFIFLFPVPIRVAAIILILIASVTVLSRGPNAGGEAAHLGGIIAGAVYVFSTPLRNKFKSKIKADRWEKKIASERTLQFELDRILKKVHDSGIHSLSSREKKILKIATEAEQKRNG